MGAKLAEHRAEMMLELYTRAAKQRQLESVLADSAMSGYIDESTADFGEKIKTTRGSKTGKKPENQNVTTKSENKTQVSENKAAENKKASQNERGEIIGLTKDGRRVYKSGFDSNVSMDERIKIFKERIATIFNLGAVELKTDVKKLQIKGDKFTVQKNIYGDLMNTDSEQEAKINALYDLADILATAKYLPDKTQPEPSFQNPNVRPKNAAHKDVKYWYKFENHIVFDDVPYTVTFNIRDKGKDQYQYLIDFKEDKTPGLSNTATKSLLRADQASYNSSISQKSDLSTENENSLFYHYMYAVVDDGSGEHIIKLTVEELLNPGKKTERRAYKLIDIEKYQPSAGVSQKKSLNSSLKAGTIKSIADLVAFVKTYDQNFSAAPEVSKYVLKDE